MIDEDFISFIAEGLRVFGPTCRVRVEACGQIGTLEFPADPNWRAPAKQFRDTRNTARSNKRGEKRGKGQS